MKRLWRHLLLILIVHSLAMLFLGFAVGRASAQAPSPLGQGDHHPHHADFYRHWMQPGVWPPKSCCNARIRHLNGGETGDCEPTRAEVRGGNWWVWVAQLGSWLPVPDSKIIRVRNPSGQDAHLCWTPTSGILCFSPPDTGG